MTGTVLFVESHVCSIEHFRKPRHSLYLIQGLTIGRVGSPGGFGYDPVFVPDLYPNLTMAELSEDAKNAISHRGVALRLMTTWLATH